MSYNKKVWKSGDRITKEALNNMENGIEAAHQNSGGSGTSYDDTEIKTDINTIKTDLGTEELTTTAKNVKGAVNEVAAQYKDIAYLINENYFILKSPNGTQYKVKITDDGTLKVTGINEQELEDLLEGRLLIWHDEFDGEELDSTKWFRRKRIWNSLNDYTDSINNSYIENGNLVIKAIRESSPFGNGKEWTSALLSTNTLFDVRYGRLEAKIKIPYVKGSFPAFWTCGSSQDHTQSDETGNVVFNGYGWPLCGEIDIMEQTDTNNTIGSNTHYANDSGAHISYGGQNSGTLDMNEYHIYACEWTNEKIDYFVDGIQIGTFLLNNATLSDGTNPFMYPHYMMLNLCVGSLAETPESDCNEMKMYVDWVRVYAPKEVTELVEATKIDLTRLDEIVTKLEMNVDNEILLRAKFTPDETCDKTIKWISGNKDVCTCYGGYIIATGEGVTTVTAQGKNVSCIIDISVSEDLTIKATNVEVVISDTKLSINNISEINLTFTPDNTTNKFLNWTTDNDNIIIADNIITANKIGNSTLIGVTSDGSNITKTINMSVISRDYDDGIITDGIKLKLTPKGIYKTEKITSSNKVTWKDDITQTSYFANCYEAYNNRLKFGISDANWEKREISDLGKPIEMSGDFTIQFAITPHIVTGLGGLIQNYNSEGNWVNMKYYIGDTKGISFELKDANNKFKSIGATINLDEFAILTMIKTPTDLSVYKNTDLISTITHGLNFTDNNTNVFTFGKHQGNANIKDTDLSCLLMYNRALNESEVFSNVEAIKNMCL